MMSINTQPNNPLHGITLKMVVTALYNHYGWEGLAKQVNVNCFKNEPSIKSALTFLRKTEWARLEVEQLYLRTFA
ncbi:VF530 family protein [Paenalcaligenes faecalis]|uniref:VF530 family protein n=1 Tax=Paenalcaligenes faecalis TaxID=2980099 RepID=UPI0022B9A9DC|nr:VF530 family protein [Paenalcaligenes faecalis]